MEIPTLEQAQSYFIVFPCFLCGTIHTLKILCYPKRNYRSPLDGLDHSIRIICIICNQARKQGKQYTKRLLPGFLRRYCRIRLDVSLEYCRTNYTNPFNLNKIYIFKNKMLFATIEASTVNTVCAPGIPEENKDTSFKISQASRNYFAHLREQYQDSLKKESAYISYSRLKESEDLK